MSPTDIASILQAIAGIPGIGPFLGYITEAFTVAGVLSFICSIIGTKLPAPSTMTGAYYWFYRTISVGALAFGHGTSLTDPANAGKVAGPQAISSPAIATTSLPVGK